MIYKAGGWQIKGILRGAHEPKKGLPEVAPVEHPHALASDRVSAGEEEGSRLSQDWPTLNIVKCMIINIWGRVNLGHCWWAVEKSPTDEKMLCLHTGHSTAQARHDRCVVVVHNLMS